MSTLIQLKDISRTYGSGEQARTVLKNINLNIQAGEMVAIIGASGSGKSTLMNIMGCLDIANRGEYYIDARNTAHLSADELAALRREHIGFIFQRYHLMPDITALANVEIPAIYAGQQRQQRRQRAHMLLERLGLAGLIYHKPGELSGGQQQRVSIARALMNGGKIILADEPTGALDSESGQEVLQILTELNQCGHTVVIVTHDMTVARHAYRIVKLQDGEIFFNNKNNPAEFAHPIPKIIPTDNVNKQEIFSCKQHAWKNLSDRLSESLQMALNSMNAHRLRTTLTMVGIIFGIASVVTVAGLGEGARQRTLESIKTLGSNVISIYPGKDFFDASAASIRTLIPADVTALAQQPFIHSASPVSNISASIRFRDKSATAIIVGIGRDYFRINGIRLLEGRLFSNDNRAIQEAIINDNTRKALFKSHDVQPIGQTVFLGTVPVRIIGITENYNDQSPNRMIVWLPYTTVLHRMLGQQHLDSISLRLHDHTSNDAASVAIVKLLTGRHGIKDFMLFNRDKLRKSIERTSMALSMLILLVASISLTIGSLGVMNIMLVSVSERTHEIGIRMAVGARRSDIMQQFMIEAVIVCLAGGALGIVFSFALGALSNILIGHIFMVVYSWQTALVAFFSSTLIGIIFGYLPARKAARMNPVLSLTNE